MFMVAGVSGGEMGDMDSPRLVKSKYFRRGRKNETQQKKWRDWYLAECEPRGEPFGGGARKRLRVLDIPDVSLSPNFKSSSRPVHVSFATSLHRVLLSGDQNNDEGRGSKTPPFIPRPNPNHAPLDAMIT